MRVRLCPSPELTGGGLCAIILRFFGATFTQPRPESVLAAKGVDRAAP